MAPTPMFSSLSFPAQERSNYNQQVEALQQELAALEQQLAIVNSASRATLDDVWFGGGTAFSALAPKCGRDL